MKITPSDIERFNSKVKPSGECLVYTGYAGTRSGHATFWVDGTMRPAHRVAWTIAHGQIPEGLCVCHHCDNPPCVRLDHLFLGTVADNNADRDAKGRGRMPAPEQIRRLTAGPIPHGTIYGYIRRKCRCSDCREAMRIYRGKGKRQAGLHLLGSPAAVPLPKVHLDALALIVLPEGVTDDTL